jgi:hypothetical protein
MTSSLRILLQIRVFIRNRISYQKGRFLSIRRVEDMYASPKSNAQGPKEKTVPGCASISSFLIVPGNRYCLPLGTWNVELGTPGAISNGG